MNGKSFGNTLPNPMSFQLNLEFKGQDTFRAMLLWQRWYTANFLSALESYHVINKVQRPGDESALRDQSKNKIFNEFRMVSSTVIALDFYQHVGFITVNYFRRNEIPCFPFIVKCNLGSSSMHTTYNLYISPFHECS